MIVGVNARFLAAPQTGVQRFAREATGRLLERCDVVLFLPRDAQVSADWAASASAVVRGALRGHAWEQLELPLRAHGRCDVLLHLANTAPLVRPGPQVVMVHDLLALTHPQWFAPVFAACYRQLLPRVIRGAAQVLTTSPTVAETIVAMTGVPAARVIAVPQGAAPFDAPASDADIARVLSAHGIRRPFALALGAGDPRKNVAFAVSVMRRYRAEHGPGLQLVVAGEVSARVHGASPAAGEAGDGVLNTGRISDAELHALYTGAAALLYPTLGEGFGRPPLESMCCGTPVLASTHVEGATALADDGCRTLPLDVDAWQEALHAVVQTGARIDAHARERLNARWSWDAAAGAVLDACSAATAQGSQLATVRA